MVYGEIPFLIPAVRRKRVKKGGIFCFFLALLGVGGAFLYSMYTVYTVEGGAFYAFCTYVGASEAIAEDEVKTCIDKGGAGVIVQENGLYCVVAAVYEDEERAMTVANQNGGSVRKLALPAYSSADKGKAEEIQKAYALAFRYVCRLSELASRWQEGKESESVVLFSVQAYQDEVKRKQEEGEPIPPVPSAEGRSLASFCVAIGANLAVWASQIGG